MKLYELEDVSDYEVDILIPHWNLRDTTLRLRLTLQNEATQMVVSAPGIGDGFEQSYRHLAQFNPEGFGPASLRNLINDTPGLKEYRVHPMMLQQTIQALYEAKQRLLDRYRRTHTGGLNHVP